LVSALKSNKTGITTIKLGGSVEAAESATLATAWFGPRGDQTPAGVYSVATLTGLRPTYDSRANGASLKNINPAWVYYTGWTTDNGLLDEPSNEPQTARPWTYLNGNDSYTWIKRTSDTSDNDFTILIWSGADRKAATLVVYPAPPADPVDEAEAAYTIVIDWSGVTFNPDS
jgi:hypothetical protein